MRRYRGFMCDSQRWQRFSFREDDIVITTPMKSGTTWTQQIVALLVVGHLDAPLAQLSPWLDATIATDQEVFDQLARQQHRRVIKTHTPLDGIPRHSAVTYVAVIRHPLDVALSMRDHSTNIDAELVLRLRTAASGEFDLTEHDSEPEDDTAYLRWWVDNDLEPDGNGPRGLADYCHSVRSYWAERHAPNVHLVHYDDLCRDLAGEVRRLAGILGVDADERLEQITASATLESMRSNALATVPFADRHIWRSADAFFSRGGRRAWPSLLDDQDLEHFHDRLRMLAGDAAEWVLRGGAGLDLAARQEG